MNINHDIKPDRWFGIFIVLHITAWTFFPGIARLNLPLDTLEGATWGRILQWGYDKDPLLNAWLTRLAIELGGYHDQFIYFFSQCMVAIGLFAIWRLAKSILPPLQALAAVVILEGVQYYNIAAIDFNDNVLQVMLWPVLVLAFYRACRSQGMLAWLAVGFSAALAFLAKYYAVMLFIPMLLFLLINVQARAALQNPGFYLALLVFIACIAPHLYWLTQHDYLTVKYSAGQAYPSHLLIDHFWQPIRFGFMQLTAFIIPALLLISLLWDKHRVLKQQALVLDSFDKQFLGFMGIGPLIFNMLYSAVTGNSIHVLWGMPLVSFWGIILVALMRPTITAKGFYRLFSMIALLIMLAGTAYAYSLITAANTSSANYPGKAIAARMTTIWRANYPQRAFKYIAGPRWLAGNIAFYSPEHPVVYMEWNPRISTWINEHDVQQHGALFVWEDKGQNQEVQELQKRFPQIKILPSELFDWQRAPSAPPIKVGIAILPPND